MCLIDMIQYLVTFQFSIRILLLNYMLGLVRFLYKFPAISQVECPHWLAQRMVSFRERKEAGWLTIMLEYGSSKWSIEGCARKVSEALCVFSSEEFGGTWLWGMPHGPKLECLSPCSGLNMKKPRTRLHSPQLSYILVFRRIFQFLLSRHHRRHWSVSTTDLLLDRLDIQGD